MINMSKKIKEKKIYCEHCGMEIVYKPYRDKMKNYVPRYIQSHNLWHYIGESNPTKGKHWKCSEEACKNMSKAKIGNTNGFKKGKKPWNYGKHLSKLHRKRLSESLKRYFRRK